MLHCYCTASTLLNVFEFNHPDSRYNSHCTMGKNSEQYLHATTFFSVVCFRTVCMFYFPFIWICTMFRTVVMPLTFVVPQVVDKTILLKHVCQHFFQGPSIATGRWFWGRNKPSSCLVLQTVITQIYIEVINFSICCYTDHCLVVAEVTGRVVVSKWMLQKFDVETFNHKIIKKTEGKEQH
jgi:hypothetical protein